MVRKTKPTGIRFDLEQLEFIKSKNENLTTPQQVVNFLLHSYWTEHKILPIFFRNKPYVEQKEEAIDDLINYGQAVIKKPVKPKIRRSFENYQGLLLACETTDEYLKLKEEIENADNLTTKQKNLLLKR